MKISKFIHFLALALGFQISAFFVFFLISESFADLVEGKLSIIPLLILMIAAVSGFIWSFIEQRKGSLLMIISGIIMAIYLLISGGINEVKMSLIFGFPFVLTGTLLFISKYSKKVP